MTARSSADISPASAAFGQRIGADSLRFERHFAAPVERLWTALVTAEGLAAWLGAPLRIEPYAGGHFELAFNAEDRLEGRILECEPNRRLVLAWRETSGETPWDHAPQKNGESVVTFEVSEAADGGSTLVLTHRYIRAGAQLSGLGAGWHAHLSALEAWVSGSALPDRLTLYERLAPAYELRFRL